MTLRLIPPVSVRAGTIRVLRHVLSGGADPCGGFAAAIARATGAAHVDLHGSGRAALSSVLRDIAAGRAGDVLVPAYTCWSVPAAVVRAGLRVRTVDVDPDSLDLDGESLDRVDPRGLVAAVGAHLFARSCDLERMTDRFGGEEIPVIEDAAQAWPKDINARVHATVLSFARGKPLALGGGGAILFPSAARLDSGATAPGGWDRAIALVATELLARPAWYRIPAAVPWLGIGTTVYDPRFDLTQRFYRWQGALGMDLLAKLDDMVRVRSRNAGRVRDAVSCCPGWRLPAPASMAGPIRCPALAPSRSERDRMVNELRRLGVSASPMYPGTILDIPALRQHLSNPAERAPGARAIAERLLTLPVHPGLQERDVDLICSVFTEAASGRASA